MSFREISLDKFNNAVWTLKPYSKSLTHWGRDKMAAISQTTFSNEFSWMKMYEFRLTFHWSWFLGVQSTIFEHWFRQWLGADQASSHYLNQRWLDYRRICVTRPQWVNTERKSWKLILLYSSAGLIRDHSGYGFGQWEMKLQCNVVSHWLSPSPDWCLLILP